MDFGSHALHLIGILHLSAFMAWLAWRAKPELVAVKPKNVAKFAGILAAMYIVKTLAFGKPMAPEFITAFPTHLMLSAWWEDVVHTLPAMAVLAAFPGKLLARIAAFLFIACSSVAFALGHMYQGPIVVLLFLGYVPFISFRYGLKHGLGTVMLCHVAYDLLTVLYAKGWPHGWF